MYAFSQMDCRCNLCTNPYKNVFIKPTYCTYFLHIYKNAAPASRPKTLITSFSQCNQRTKNGRGTP